MAAKPAAKGKGGGGGAQYAGRKSLYALEGNKVKRERKACPKCGPGIFMATHKDRAHCGRCGYTEFPKKA